jgi:hypothetical protein
MRLHTLILALVVVLFLAGARPVAAESDPPFPPPGGQIQWSCFWKGNAYPHGALRFAPVNSPQGQLLYYDVYRCRFAAWLYVGSSDDNK